MRDYKELVERLHKRLALTTAGSPLQNDLLEAADAIKVLLISAQTETAKRIVGKSRGGMTLWYQCGVCNEPVDAQDNFCRKCGRRLIDE